MGTHGEEKRRGCDEDQVGLPIVEEQEQEEKEKEKMIQLVTSK